MAYARFGKDIRNLVCAFYSDGIIYKNPSKKFIRAELSEDRIEVLRKIVRLIMFTEYTDEYTKLYLSNPTLSYKEVANILGSDETTLGEKLTDNQVKGKVWHKIDKLKNAFGAESIMRITMYRNNDISQIVEKVNSLLLENSIGIQSNFDLELSSNMFNGNLSDKEFNEMVELIYPYSRKTIELVQRAITNNMKDYMNYLEANRDSLTTEELERYNILVDL